jgi:FkbM family methyltransferase
MIKKLKKEARLLLNKFGYDILSLSKQSNLRTSIGQSYIFLQQLGFKPSTVIDVGAASGTRELYTAFPDAYHLLIEPLKQNEAFLVSILKKYKGSYVLAAAGAKRGEVTFNAYEEHPDGSSLYKQSMGIEADGKEITVPMVSVDDVIKEKKLQGPYLMKVDVQGAELDVLAGAQQTLKESEAVVLEVSLFEFMKGAPEFYDVISYMKNHDFVAYDIVLGWNRPLDNALGQVDIVFVKEKGWFRQNHAYSTFEQRNVLLKSKRDTP